MPHIASSVDGFACTGTTASGGGASHVRQSRVAFVFLQVLGCLSAVLATVHAVACPAGYAAVSRSFAAGLAVLTGTAVGTARVIFPNKNNAITAANGSSVPLALPVSVAAVDDAVTALATVPLLCPFSFSESPVFPWVRQ
jgi:hypothetical protein